MSKADVGDDQRREDPTVRELEERLCAECGKEAALFLPTGTMCNIVALFLHCRPGDEVFTHRHSHIAYGELGGPSVHSRVVLQLLDGPRGAIDVPTLRAALQERPYGLRARAGLLSLENTHNYAGGAIIAAAKQGSVCAAARELGLFTHLDGARLFNASVASNVSVSEYCKPFDSIWIDLTKGLGCPAGAVLMGSQPFIEEAVAVRRMFGGAMRQAGVLAAAGLFALEHNVERLRVDHDRARWFAGGVDASPGLSADPTSVETNIVHVEVRGGAGFLQRIVERTRSAGVRFGQVNQSTIRAVTHLDVSDRDVKEARAVLHDASIAVFQAGGGKDNT
jgi:threonine aldolase